MFVGWIAKTVVKQRPFGISKTAVRKIFQSAASFGVGSCLFLITFNGGSLVYVIVLLQCTSLLSIFAAGGETMLPYDLSDQFPATIMAIANSIANLSGLTVTTMTGKILGDQGGSNDRWNILLYLIAGSNIIGGLVFIILVKAEMIDFSDGDEKQIREQKLNSPELESNDLKKKLNSPELESNDSKDKLNAPELESNDLKQKLKEPQNMSVDAEEKLKEPEQKEEIKPSRKCD